jgi:hypothetical protein
MGAADMKRIAILGALLLALASCKSEQPKSEGEPAGEVAAEAGSSEAEVPTPAEQPPATELDRLLKWIPSEPLAVAYDRLGQRLDPSILAVVFGVPPKAADVLEERDTLDEALPLVFEGDAEASKWLGSTSLAFTVALSRSPYFVRPLSKPAAEVQALLGAAGFSKNTMEGVELWLPSGSFPWRIALLEGDVAAFIPVDVPGAGLEPLVPSAAGAEADTAETGETGGEVKAPALEPTAPSDAKTAVETELRRTLTEDPMIELVLVASGPLVHYDVQQSIAQVQFALRRIAPPDSPAYEGRIVLTPSADADECANDLRKRKYPEENQQVQALVAGVEFMVIEGGVIGRLEIPPDQVKHFHSR